jgi:hypothetical protein
MKTLIAPLVAAALLIVAADGLRRAAGIEDALAAAGEELTTTGATSRDTGAALDAALAIGRRVPVLGTRLDADVRRHRAAEAYWQRDYAALVTGALAPAPDDADVSLLLLSANAVFRQTAGRVGSPQELARALDDVLEAYDTLLERDPGNADAAFNYEYVARLRSALAGGRMSAMPEQTQQDMQGEEGEPPQGTRKSDFNVIVPLRPEERQEQLDPGSGTTFQRKG